MRAKKLGMVLSVLTLLAVVFGSSHLAGAAPTSTPTMVKDIVSGSGDLATFASDVRIFMDGNIAYFSATSTGGDGLWKSDGTEAGTVLVASATDMGGVAPANFVKMGSNIYFTVISPASETLVKKFDGSTVTTVADNASIKTAVSGSGAAADYGINTYSLWVSGSYVYFVGYDLSAGANYFLFRTNGTSVTQATTDAAGSAGDIGPVFELDGTTFYYSYSNANGSGFESIPSAGGRKSAVISGVTYYSPQQGKVAVLPGTPDRAYMLMGASNGGYTVISFDGTSASVVTDGTTRIQYAGLPTKVGTRIYFIGADNGPGDDALWYTTSTSATEVKPAQAFNFPMSNVGMQGSLNDSVFLFYNRGATNFELWRSDGTDAGTYVVADTYINRNSSSTVAHLYDAQTEIFFPSASVSDTSIRVRKSDGTVAGTSAPFDLTPTVESPRRFAQGTSSTFFIAVTSGSGYELHVVVAGTTPTSTTSTTSSPNNPTTTTTVAGAAAGTTTTAPSANNSGSGGTSSAPTNSEIARFSSLALIENGTATAGSDLEVVAGGFTPLETVNAIFQGSSSVLGSGRASSVGKASVSLTIPSSASGRKTLVLYGTTSRKGVKQIITISKTALPTTGSHSRSPLMLGAVLLLAGCVILTRSRKPSRSEY